MSTPRRPPGFGTAKDLQRELYSSDIRSDRKTECGGSHGIYGVEIAHGLPPVGRVEGPNPVGLVVHAAPHSTPLLPKPAFVEAAQVPQCSSAMDRLPTDGIPCIRRRSQMITDGLKRLAKVSSGDQNKLRMLDTPLPRVASTTACPGDPSSRARMPEAMRLKM